MPRSGHTPSDHIDWDRGSICISVDSEAQCQHNGAFLDSLAQFDRKLLMKNVGKCKNKVRRHDNWQQCMSYEQTIFDVFEFGFHHLSGKMSNLSIPHPWAYNGRCHVIELTSDDLLQKSKIYEKWILGACYFLKVLSFWERLSIIGNVAKLRHFFIVCGGIFMTS